MGRIWWHKDRLEEQDADEDEPHLGRPDKEATHENKGVAYDKISSTFNIETDSRSI
jgi:hypothetical protein